jgi:hypothetical protein
MSSVLLSSEFCEHSDLPYPTSYPGPLLPLPEPPSRAKALGTRLCSIMIGFSVYQLYNWLDKMNPDWLHSQPGYYF